MTFTEYLRGKNLSEATIGSYTRTVDFYKRQYGELSEENLRKYRDFLIKNYRTQTVNVRVQAMNKYLGYMSHPEWKIKTVRIQRKLFVNNVISSTDYQYFKDCLLRDKKEKWYFIVSFLGATGARISELVQIRVEHIEQGLFELYGKGKIRYVYLPKNLQQDMLAWLKEDGRTSGYVFLNRFGDPISPRGVSRQLKRYASIYGLDPSVIYPHSFRHMYAKRMLEKSEDIAFLADLMGHTSIETTRIYLHKSIEEQYQLVNQIVTW